MGYYLQVGDLILANGTEDSSGYSLTGAPSFPEPNPDAHGGHEAAVRQFAVRCTGTTASAAAYNANVLRRECVKDNLLSFRHGGTGDVLTCRIREAKCTEASYTPGGREAFGVVMNVQLTTDPYWLGPWTSETSASASVTLPCDHFDVSGTEVAGEVDALLTLRCVTSDASAMGIYIGVKPEPNASYQYLDDYSVESLTASATYAAYTGSATFALNANDNRGRHLFLARLDPQSSGTNGYAYVSTTTTGYGISAATSVAEQAVSVAKSSNYVHELGTIQIPSAQIPALSAAAGYGTEEVSASNTTASAWTSSSTGWTGYPGYGLTQSFPVSTPCQHIGFSFYANSTSSATVYGAIIGAISDLPGSWYTVLATGYVNFQGSGVQRIDWDSPPVLQTGNYCLCLTGWDLTASALSTPAIKYSTASSYANGKACIDSTASSSADLYFLSHSKPALAFTNRNYVYIKDSTADLWALDWAARIPVDFGAVCYRETSSGTIGLYYDGDTDIPYSADSDGIGPAVLDKCEVRKPLRLRPGVTNRVVIAVKAQNNSDLGAATLTYAIRPRYLTAAS